MKVTNSEIIKSGERELIDTIIADLDWNMIEKIVKDRHQLKIQDDIDYRQGDIVVHNDQVAYRLDFDVKMTLSIILTGTGTISLSTHPMILRTRRNPNPVRHLSGKRRMEAIRTYRPPAKQVNLFLPVMHRRPIPSGHLPRISRKWLPISRI